MSFAVLHINKASGSATAIARHIERSSQPDNAHPELRHLNRDDFIRYPAGIADLEGAIRHRIAHSGITRKVADNQVLALNVLMTSDGEALRRIADEGRLDEWAAVSIGWAKRTFGEDNVVGAHLHMDERTPHLHVTVVPIVTTERKKKAKEAKATKRYRKKAANAPRLSADDLMQREKLTMYQDTYAEVMQQFGLERGIRGSEARHVSQHKYYRECQIKKKGLEQDIVELTDEKKELESRNRQLERGNSFMDKKYAETKAANADLVKKNSNLESQIADMSLTQGKLREANATIATSVLAKDKQMKDLDSRYDALADEVSKLEMRKLNAIVPNDLKEFQGELNRYLPDASQLLKWGRYCSEIGFSDPCIQHLLRLESVRFKGQLYSPEHSQHFETERSEAKLERTPNDPLGFMLKIDGMSIFEWFRKKAREFLELLGFKPREPKQNNRMKIS